MSTTRTYFHPDLMYTMFVEDKKAKGCDSVPNSSTYTKVSKQKNLSSFALRKANALFALLTEEMKT